MLLERLSASSDFNDQQYLVEHAPSDRNVLVAAGAGTGKTFSMVSRVAFLCSKKADAVAHLEEEIAMVTFTNDAVNNMKSRLKQMFVNYFILTNQPRYLKFVEDVDRAHISTIHRFALEILRSAPLYTGLGTNFRIGSNEYLRGKLYDAYLGGFSCARRAGKSQFYA
ncbi:UvrD-helicase domain-containing protein [Selenomonas sp. FOBRC6]|uniref:UvrD-helicase domain-containing protein n=1 Tax=Selenomonas sp. FOBRC6 TaxID=936572 RepID=UPI0008FB37C3|nr:UvrD-helicase domain-containing protein [Selenomonas sp. FOBRC6]